MTTDEIIAIIQKVFPYTSGFIKNEQSRIVVCRVSTPESWYYLNVLFSYGSTKHQEARKYTKEVKVPYLYLSCENERLMCNPEDFEQALSTLRLSLSRFSEESANES